MNPVNIQIQTFYLFINPTHNPKVLKSEMLLKFRHFQGSSTLVLSFWEPQLEKNVKFFQITKLIISLLLLSTIIHINQAKSIYLRDRRSNYWQKKNDKSHWTVPYPPKYSSFTLKPLHCFSQNQWNSYFSPSGGTDVSSPSPTYHCYHTNRQYWHDELVPCSDSILSL